MPVLILVLLASLALGVLLTLMPAAWPLRGGWVGVLVMVAAAWATRRRWLLLALAGGAVQHQTGGLAQGRLLLADAAPGSPERALWIGFAGTAVVGAHLFAILYRIGPNMVMHTDAVHALGIDNWTLVAGALIAHWIARDPEPRQDERDAAIAVAGLRAAHYGLMLLLAVQILALGFVQRGWIAQLSHPSIAHALILSVMAGLLIDHGTRLWLYARDAVQENVA